MKNLFEVTDTVRPASNRSVAATPSTVDILILSDGTILVHNLTPAVATILNALNPNDPTIKPRITEQAS
jgi:hypothetical protein